MIEVRDLRKSYGAVDALQGVTFTVAPGEVFGLLGPNGAGKTTTLRILTGRTRPTAGSATVDGLDVVRDRGALPWTSSVVFEQPNLYARFSGRDNLCFFAALYGVEPGRVDAVLATVGLDPHVAARPVRTYSTGMTQRLMLARALLPRPRVLLLDEPTRGIDPATTRALRQLVVDLRAQGTTVLLTTHELEDADALCDRLPPGWAPGRRRHPARVEAALRGADRAGWLPGRPAAHHSTR